MSATARLGAFMLLALLILGFFILKIERLQFPGEKARQGYKAVFPSVAGLNEKAPARIAGVKIGIVDKIALERDHAVVSLDVDPTVKLHQGAKATVRSLGLLGEQYVEIDPGPQDAPLLPEGSVLAGGTPGGMDKVFETANDIGTDLKAVTVSLRNSLGGPEGQRRLDEIVGNIDALTKSLRLIAEENRVEVAATMQNVRAVSESLRTQVPLLAEKLNELAGGLNEMVRENRQNIAGSTANVRDISERLKVTADNLNTITGKIASGEGTVGKLINDDTTVNNLNSTLKSVESGVADLKNTLGRAGRWELDVDLHAERIAKLDDSRSAFNADLHTTDRRFYRLGLTKAPRGRELVKNETITTSFEGGPPQTFTQESRSYTNDFTYNAQVGYRIGWTTFRAGLIESLGGVGVDRTIVKDKIDATLEAWDFSRRDYSPHLRFQARYFVTPNIYAYAGYDDPLAKPFRSVIIGAGITWKDEDMKYLIGTAASTLK